LTKYRCVIISPKTAYTVVTRKSENIMENKRRQEHMAKECLKEQVLA